MFLHSIAQSQGPKLRSNTSIVSLLESNPKANLGYRRRDDDFFLLLLLLLPPLLLLLLLSNMYEYFACTYVSAPHARLVVSEVRKG